MIWISKRLWQSNFGFQQISKQESLVEVNKWLNVENFLIHYDSLYCLDTWLIYLRRIIHDDRSKGDKTNEAAYKAFHLKQANMYKI